MLRLKEFWKLASIGLVLVALALLFGVTQAETKATVSYTPTDLIPLTGIAQVSAGEGHTCALTTNEGVMCWGDNKSGQLGDGTTTNRSTPVDVVGLTSSVQAISAGSDHTCALTTQGGVKCWGSNKRGSLGDGSTISSQIPVDVVGLSTGAQAISARGGHTCVLTTNSGIKCWGINNYGQLGDGTATNRFTPVDVVGLVSGVQAISTGSSDTCAVTNQGGVKCWGGNYAGQLGDGTYTQHLTPFDVVGLASGVQALSAGEKHTCALTTQGGIKCWGANNSGQLGDGTYTQHLTPIDVVGLASSVQAISAGSDHTCALSPQGGVKCWGGNANGRLGDGTTTNRFTPVDVVSLTSGMQAISVGADQTCALSPQGGVKCWGGNYFGQLGDGTAFDRYAPGEVLIEAAHSGYSFSGKVTDATGVGKPNVTITNGEKTVVTDQNGNYSFTNVAVGTYTIHPLFSSEFINAPVNRVVMVDKDVKDVNFRQYPSPKQFLSIPIDLQMPLSQLILRPKAKGAQTSRFDHNSPARSKDVDKRVWFWDGSVFDGVTDAHSCDMGRNCYTGHAGLDLDDVGGNVLAVSAADGILHTVTSSTTGYGRHVVIDHLNGYATLYGHLENFNAGISQGEKIKRGDPIGLIGNSGFSTTCQNDQPRCGTHLHFGVYFDRNGDGEWSINDESEVVDPFGWCTRFTSCNADPWEVQSGMVSYYLWNEVLEEYAALSVGGTVIQMASGAVEFNLPANAINEASTLEVHLNPITDYFEHLAEFYQSINPYFSIQIREWLQPDLALASGEEHRLNQPMVVTLKHSQPLHFDPNSLTVARFDVTTQAWQNFETTLVDESTVQFQTDQMGQYALLAQLLCPAEPSEPNDLDVSSESLTVGQTSGVHVFDHDADVDWFAAELQAGVEYFVTIDGLAATATIYNSDGKTTVQEAAQKFTALESGEYFIRVSRQVETPVGCDAEFNILLDDQPSEPAQNPTVYLPLIQR